MRVRIRAKEGMNIEGAGKLLIIDGANWVEWEPNESGKILITTARGSCFEVQMKAVKSIAFCPLDGPPSHKRAPVQESGAHLGVIG